MKSLVTFDLPTRDGFDVVTRLDERRIHRLGCGARVDRTRLRLVCGTASAANQWLDKASKEGLLVPVAWGAYQVVEMDVLDALRHASEPSHRRLVSWSMTLPKTLHPEVAFLAPVVWRDTGLAWDHPAPIVPFDGTQDRAPAQLNVFGWSLNRSETWGLRVGDRPTVAVKVPSRLDSTILLGSNIDGKWQRAALHLAKGLRQTERLHARRQLLRLRRFGATAGSGHRGAGPSLRTPRWWDDVHERALEELVRKTYAI